MLPLDSFTCMLPFECVKLNICMYCLRLRQAQAAEGDVKFLEPDAAIVGRFVEQKDGWQRFETLDFQLDVPPGFEFVPVPQNQPLPGLHPSLCLNTPYTFRDPLHL